MEEKKKLQEVKDETILTNYLSQQLFHLPASSNLSDKIKNHNYVFRLMLIEKSNYHQTGQKPLSSEDFKPIIEKMQISSVGIGMHDNQFVLFIYDREGISTEKVNRLTSLIIAAFDEGVSLAISSSCNDMHQLANLYQELNARLSFYRGSDNQVVTDSESLPVVNDYELSKQQIGDLADAVFQQNKAVAERIMDRLFTDFKEQLLTLQQIKKQCLILLESIRERGQESMFEQLEFQLKEETDLLIFNSISALQDLFLKDLDNVIDYMQRSDDSHWIIQQAKQYIEKNYQKDIKAVEVAESHYITPNYFSMLFKQETGYNYSEYLNTIRINKAKELLSDTSNKVFEIAEYVGYREYKYFVQVFKNYVGITPTQFRKLHFIEK